MNISPQPTYLYNVHLPEAASALGKVNLAAPKKKSYLPILILGSLTLVILFGLWYFQMQSKQKVAKQYDDEKDGLLSPWFRHL